jgi:hypothetical protein
MTYKITFKGSQIHQVLVEALTQEKAADEAHILLQGHPRNIFGDDTDLEIMEIERV